MTTRIKVGIVGSRKYTDKRKIKDLIFEIKNKYGDEVEVVSGGQKDGADGLAKKYALEFDLKYTEFPPAHYNHNMHCIRPRGEYNNPYYYPVIPKFNAKGSFKPEVFGLQTNSDGSQRIPFGGIVYDGQNWTPNDLIAELTIENSTSSDLLINLNSNIVFLPIPLFSKYLRALVSPEKIIL